MNKEMPRKFWNILYWNGINPNNFILVRSDYDSLQLKTREQERHYYQLGFKGGDE
ncbi:hypothetical protein [Clostridium kluyveri]|uniref:hypothetical protein n=1 Tax=Clostridium kluyveri TaxID=1534 RepID=UPI0012EB7DAE|nr:hypothetical protein [Clostridium kluyveri]